MTVISKSTIQGQAYHKIILHACKYVTQELIGVLIGRISDGNVFICDVVPAFHTIPLPPMLEIAMMQVYLMLFYLNMKD